MAAFRYRDRRTEELNHSVERSLSQEELFCVAPYHPEAGEDAGNFHYSYWRTTLRTFIHNRVAVFFLVLIAAILVFAFLEPLLPYAREANTIYRDPVTGLVLSSQAPSKAFWFGTNVIGQDLWSQIWSGTRNSLLIGFAVALVEMVVGVFVGVLWGYARKLDFLFTEIYNVFDNIPQTLMVIIISYILRPGVGTMIFAMCLTSWLGTARMARNQVVIIRDRDFNLASRYLGTSPVRVITRNLLPYLISILTLRMTLAIPAAISNEVFITYIGLGVPLETPSLGNLIEEGRKLMMEPTLCYQLFFPVAILSVVIISFYVVGNTFADVADPKNHIK